MSELMNDKLAAAFRAVEDVLETYPPAQAEKLRRPLDRLMEAANGLPLHEMKLKPAYSLTLRRDSR